MARAFTAQDLMSRSLVTLKPDMDMEQAIHILLKNKVSGATVVNDEGEIQGVLSEKDCLRIFTSGAYNSLPKSYVRDYMTKEVTTIAPEADLFRVADLFLKNSFRRLPVVEDGILVGQVSRRDVLERSRELWQAAAPPKEWTDSKYIPDALRARLESRKY